MNNTINNEYPLYSLVSSESLAALEKVLTSKDWNIRDIAKKDNNEEDK